MALVNFLRTPRRRQKAKMVDVEAEARLEDAEREVKKLTARGEQAARFLSERQQRNHWRESIEQMIRGVEHG